MSKIEIKNVYKIFGSNPDTVLPLVKEGASKEEVLEETGHTVGLDNVSINIEEGETFVCMGLSGSGKSTLIRHLNRLIDPTDGDIIVDGTNVMELNEKQLIEFRKHEMSMVFQRFGLFPHKTVLENVGYGLEIQGKEPEERKKLSMIQVESVGLQGFENQYPSQLSGGMQQRVGLARALATNPQILLMDEAFSALDPLIRSDMQNQLIELQAKLKKTIVFITHDLDEALRIGDNIAILRDGEIIQTDSPQEILLTPADSYIADFMKDINRARILRVQSIMRPLDLETDGPSMSGLTTLEQALQVFGTLATDKLIIVDQNEKKIGILTLEQLIKSMKRPEAEEIKYPIQAN